MTCFVIEWKISTHPFTSAHFIAKLVFIFEFNILVKHKHKMWAWKKLWNILDFITGPSTVGHCNPIDIVASSHSAN